ncbi:MAG: thiamine pyrophosphate-dependent dehydrogenase E1 component subunit alpha [Anaerolineae bacterium]|nr:MAG: thiamine pyrophosphate-dependent dehydrogenase E1 component subunit alpha [Anaerolineae bacterium]
MSNRLHSNMLPDLQRSMLVIRHLETELQKLCDQGLAGDLHFNRGQEAIAVGVCSALRASDRIVTHHRTIAHYIAKGGDLDSLVGEVLNRKTGCNRGLAGEMHLSNQAIGYDFSFQLVGTCIPVADGIAWAHKYHHKDDAIVACFFGDSATANGQFHEGLNIAAIHKLPILFVCEDNHRAGNITPEYYTPEQIQTTDRFHAFGIPVRRVDGNDVDEVRVQAAEFAAHARLYGPCALVCDTERLCWHKQGQRDARTAEELAAASRRDPLLGVEIPDDIKQSVYHVITRALAAETAEEWSNG